MKNIERAIDFAMLMEEMKKIERQTRLIDSKRRENDAEHSYHVAMMAWILQDYSDLEIDINKVIKMLLVHDLPEIYAGDVPVYDVKANLGKREREIEALDRLGGQMSSDLEEEIKSLWYEFEEKKSNEALYAHAMDRIQPVLMAHRNKGVGWIERGARLEDSRGRVEFVKDVSKEIWEYMEWVYEDSVEKGYLLDD